MIFCNHKDARETGLVCEHLLEKREGSEYFKGSQKYHRYFTGKAAKFVLICPACAEDGVHHGVTHWRTICHNCVLNISGSQKICDLGSPEISISDTGLRLKHEQHEVRAEMAGFSAIAPLGTTSEGAWITVTSERRLVRIVPTAGKWEEVAELAVLPINPELQISLVASDDGRYVAIVNTYDSKGCVWDMEKRSVVLSFDRKDYYNEHCRYPVAFTKHEGKTLVIYATDWNRLDVLDLETGKPVAERAWEIYKDVNDDRPAHYLDYFHCGLAVSPNGEWLADNGWVWHPFGVVSTWSLKKWLQENPWESEDGTSKKYVCDRAYYWDGPMCWVGSEVLAVWGLGDDDYTLVPGVMLFDVTTGQELKRFAGPLGDSKYEMIEASETESSIYNAAGTMVFDKYLFSWMPKKPFSVWDVEDGARLLEVSDYTPMAYHYGTKEFLSVTTEGTLCLSRVV
ncbi:MAG TPA: hypothetical protein VGH19_21410 [Verrucomicrobiae bacterium]